MKTKIKSYRVRNESQASRLIAELESAGISVSTDGQSIICKARKESLTAGLREAIARHKPALIEHLQQRVNNTSETGAADLSFSQERLWLADQLEQDPALFLILKA